MVGGEKMTRKKNISKTTSFYHFQLFSRFVFLASFYIFGQDDISIVTSSVCFRNFSFQTRFCLNHGYFCQKTGFTPGNSYSVLWSPGEGCRGLGNVGRNGNGEISRGKKKIEGENKKYLLTRKSRGV